MSSTTPDTLSIDDDVISIDSISEEKNEEQPIRTQVKIDEDSLPKSLFPHLNVFAPKTEEQKLKENEKTIEMLEKQLAKEKELHRKMLRQGEEKKYTIVLATVKSHEMSKIFIAPDDTEFLEFLVSLFSKMFIEIEFEKISFKTVSNLSLKDIFGVEEPIKLKYIEAPQQFLQEVLELVKKYTKYKNDLNVINRSLFMPEVKPTQDWNPKDLSEKTSKFNYSDVEIEKSDYNCLRPKLTKFEDPINPPKFNHLNPTDHFLSELNVTSAIHEGSNFSSLESCNETMSVNAKYGLVSDDWKRLYNKEDKQKAIKCTILFNEFFGTSVILRDPNQKHLDKLLEIFHEFKLIKRYENISPYSTEIMENLEKYFQNQDFDSENAIISKINSFDILYDLVPMEVTEKQVFDDEKAIVTGYLRENYVLDNNVKNTMLASTIYGKIERDLSLSVENVTNFRKRISQYLLYVGLKKKRTNQGIVYYGILEKTEVCKNRDIVHSDETMKKDFDKLLKERENDVENLNYNSKPLIISHSL